MVMGYDCRMEIYGDTLMFGSVRSAPDTAGPGETEPASAIDAIRSVEQVYERQRRAIADMRAAQLARLSDPRTARDAAGVLWEYVVVDGAYARVTDCILPDERPACLEVPGGLDGFCVREMGSDACSMLDGVEEVVCADSIEEIGASAFRLCRDLRRLVLPKGVSTYDASWVNQCRRLEELVLPDALERIGPAVLECESLRVLCIGAATRCIEPGAFAQSRLLELHVSEENPYLATDCVSVFENVTADDGSPGLRLAALAVACEEYDVPAGCIEIGAKAFACCPGLARIALPDGLRAIGPHAFSRTALTALEAPASLRAIGRRAFYRCKRLEKATLNDGLREIGPEAFADSGLTSLRVPASVRSLSRDCVRGTAVACSGPAATLAIGPGSALWLDECGVLYDDAAPEGRALVGMMDLALVDYDVVQGCDVIGARAFADAPELRRVALPDGVTVIDDGAFRGCRELRDVRFPESLRSIGDEAFYDTELGSLYLPAGFEHLGDLALVTAGARVVGGRPSLAHVTVRPDCARFYHADGLLVERLEGGSSRVIWYDGSCGSVVIPRDVDTIAPLAFGNATGLRELTVGTWLVHIGNRAFDVACLIEHIHVEIDPPIEGHDHIDLHFPSTLRSMNEIIRGFNAMGYLNIELLLARYDACVINMHDYDAQSMAPPDLYGQVRRIIERLGDPLCLSEANRRMYVQILRDNLVDMCVAIARHDDRACLDALVDLGLLDHAGIVPVIEAVAALQDAAMTGYLLELKRTLFGMTATDFDL